MYNNSNSNAIKVSVLCITCNHENFINDALHGIIMQKTNFQFEVIVHDDASTDRTSDIVKEYESKYPGLFRCIYQITNQHSIDDRLYIRFLLPIAKGKYITYCEGDDYWTDPFKLQKQFDFMEANSEYAACYHSYLKRIYNTISNIVYPIKPKDFSKEDLIATPRYLELLTRFEKNLYQMCPVEDLWKFCGHFLSNAYLGTVGACKYLEDIKPSVKNIHSGGTWSRKNDAEKFLTRVWIGAELYQLFLERGNVEHIKIRLECLKKTLLEADSVIGYSKNRFAINKNCIRIYFCGLHIDIFWGVFLKKLNKIFHL